ncbi:Telomerase protein component 1 [Chamberlinius hualienensis]
MDRPSRYKANVKMSNVKFDTENKILKCATSTAKRSVIYGGSNSSALLGLCSTENKILKQLSCGNEVKSCNVMKYQLSCTSSAEPSPKKVKKEFTLEDSSLIQDEIMSFESNCQYDFIWPEKVESEKNYSETSVSEAKAQIKLHHLIAKENLINAVSVSLIQGPSLKDVGDPFRLEIIEKCRIVAEFDPEFILKMALYTRQELNIRTTTSILLAFSVLEPRCRPFLKRYFKLCVLLPTDWMAVADQFKLINDKNDKPGFLPTALRKVMVEKFSDFDEYQLAKYNRGKKRTNQRKSIDEAKKSVTFTLKKLIEILHIRDPANFVMGILGKKYPDSPETFSKSRLPGMWDETLAGQKMKLERPETWETWVSIRGNRADTWETLIDDKKLPYMAMLRNLRNIFIAGISNKHHQLVVKHICNKNAVLKSKQFPYRFYVAQDVLKDLQNIMFDEGETEVQKKRPSGSRKFNSANYAIEKRKKVLKAKIKNASTHCSKELFNQYRKALEEAVEISAFFNIPPIQGRTLIFLDVGSHMEQPCFAAKSMGKPMLMSKLAKIIVDMCRRACERCDVNEFFVKTHSFNYKELNLSIAANEMLDITLNHQKVDTVLYVTNDDTEIDFVTDWVRHHRAIVNPQLLYMHLAISGAQPKVNTSNKHSNDLRLVGYTDAVFRFISEKCNTSRMEYLDNLDKKYELAPVPVRVCEPIRSLTRDVSPFRWQTVRVFISSTFLDMQSERDLLIRHVFPELRRRAKALCLDVFEVDLRWGLKESEDYSVAQLCLDEVLKCHIFLGVLGERYGTIPDWSQLRLKQEAVELLEKCSEETSITEMEILFGALGDSKNCSENAFFYLRNNDFLKNIPNEYREMFEEEDEDKKSRLKDLKTKIKGSGMEVFDGYPCCWGGVTMDGRPAVGGLEQFGQRVLENIWNALIKIRQDRTEVIETESGEQRTQEAFALKQHKNFVGCDKTVQLSLKTVESMKRGVALLIGKQGAGKTALIAHLYNLVKTRWSKRCVAIPFITAASPSIFTMTSITNYFMEEFSHLIEIDDTIVKAKGIQRFYEITKQVVEKCGKLILFLDGLDSLPKMEHQSDAVDWLNADWPTGIVIVCSCNLNGILCKRLRSSNFVQTILIGPLVLKDRMQIMRNRLADYGKHLDETFLNNQLRQLSMKRDSNLPLYLSLVCEDLSKFGDFNQLTNKVNLIKATVEGLIDDSIMNLEQQFGVGFVEAAFAFIVVSPSGLIEEELYSLMGFMDLIKKPLISDISTVCSHVNVRIPVAKFLQLIRSIRSFTEASASTISLSTASSVLTVVRERYKHSILSPSIEMQLHRIIAGHLWVECGNGFDWSVGSFKTLAALPYHLIGGGCINELANMLCDLTFIKARFMSGSGNQLLEDYKYAIDIGFNSSRCSNSSRKSVENFGGFVKRNLKILNAEPTLVVQQALNDLECSDVKSSAVRLIDTTPGVMLHDNKENDKMKIKMIIDTKENCLCVALSHDGGYLAFGEGAIVHLYDLYSETKFMSLVGHAAVVTCLLFADKSRLCSGSADGTVAIWNIEVGHRVFVLKKHIRRVSSLCLDSTKRCLISAGWDSAVYVWRLSDGELISTVDWKSKWAAVSCVISHPHKPMILTGSWDGKLRIWCLQTLKRKSLLHGHTSGVLAVSITACGTLMASSSMDLTLKIWSCTYGFQLASIPLDTAITSLNYELNVDDDIEYLFAGCGDGSLRMYSCKLGQLVRNTSACRKSPLTCLAINEKNIIAGYEDGCAQLMICRKNYSCENRLLTTFGSVSVTCIHCMIASVNDYQFENYIVLGMSNGEIHIADGNLCGIKILTGRSSAIKVIATSNKYIISGDANGVIAINVSPWKKSDAEIPCNHMAIIHNGCITSISFRNDDKWIATTGVDEHLKLWKISDLMTKLNSPLSNFPPMTDNSDVFVKACHNGPITSSCWVENSRATASNEYFVITSGNDLKLCAWNSENGQNIWVKTDFNASIYQLRSTKNSILGFLLDGSVYVWDCMGIEISRIFGSNEDISAVYFNLEDEKSDWYREVVEEEQNEKPTKTKPLQCVAEQLSNIYIARCHANGQISVVKPCFRNKAKTTMLCHSQAVLSVAHGVDKKIATSSLDGTVRVYYCNDLYENKVDVRFKKHASRIACLSFIKMNDGSVAIATGDRAGYLMVWIKDENNEWRAVTRNRTHEKSVNAIVVLGSYKSTCYLSTCSDDCSIKCWAFGASEDVTSSKFSLKIKEDVLFRPICIESPIKEPHGQYQLKLKEDHDICENLICVDYSSEKGILVAGVTRDTVESYTVVFNFGKAQLFNIFFRVGYDARLPSRANETKPWIVHVKMVYEAKADLFLTFLVNSYGELWLSKHSSVNYHNPDTFNYGSVSNIGEKDIDISGCSLDMNPHSMDVVLVESSHDSATFHQFIGLASGVLLSIRLEVCYNDSTAVNVLNHESIHLHRGCLAAINCHQRNTEYATVMVFTGGDDGIIRQSRLNLSSGTFTKMANKFFCDGAVTCIKSADKSEKEIFISCADALGNMYAIYLSC